MTIRLWGLGLTALLVLNSGQARAQTQVISRSPIRYSYDVLGRTVVVDDSGGASNAYEYDRAGNRQSVITVQHFVAAFGAALLYHGIGRLEGGGWVADTTMPSAYMSYGPYTPSVPVGARVGAWRLLIDNNSADDRQVIEINVFDSTTGSTLASRVITRTEFTDPSSYQVFELPFVLTPDRQYHYLEFRTRYLGYSYVRLDKVGYR